MQEAYAAKKDIADPDSVPMSEIVCPDCGTKGEWTEPREFNMMLKTYLGPIETEEDFLPRRRRRRASSSTSPTW